MPVRSTNSGISELPLLNNVRHQRKNVQNALGDNNLRRHLTTKDLTNALVAGRTLKRSVKVRLNISDGILNEIMEAMPESV